MAARDVARTGDEPRWVERVLDAGLPRQARMRGRPKPPADGDSPFPAAPVLGGASTSRTTPEGQPESPDAEGPVRRGLGDRRFQHLKPFQGTVRGAISPRSGGTNRVVAVGAEHPVPSSSDITASHAMSRIRQCMAASCTLIRHAMTCSTGGGPSQPASSSAAAGLDVPVAGDRRPLIIAMSGTLGLDRRRPGSVGRTR